MTKTYNVVSNQNLNNLFKRSKYYKVDLGTAITMEKNGERIISDKDHFAASYNYQYKTFIYAQGKIGNIRFYTDHGILEDKIAAYLDLEEFVFDYDKDYVAKKGVESYIGHILKQVDELNSERIETIKQEQEDKKTKVGTPDKLKMNPGSVTYEDLQAYIRNKRI
jgi:hypothetical protein